VHRVREVRFADRVFIEFETVTNKIANLKGCFFSNDILLLKP